jgi:hypothetical protein
LSPIKTRKVSEKKINIAKEMLLFGVTKFSTKDMYYSGSGKGVKIAPGEIQSQMVPYRPKEKKESLRAEYDERSP